MNHAIVAQEINLNTAVMKINIAPEVKFGIMISSILAMSIFFILLFFSLLNTFIVNENVKSQFVKEHESIECIVIDHIGDHDVKLIDKKNKIWTLQVENAYDSAYIKGTVIFIKVP